MNLTVNKEPKMKQVLFYGNEDLRLNTFLCKIFISYLRQERYKGGDVNLSKLQKLTLIVRGF